MTNKDEEEKGEETDSWPLKGFRTFNLAFKKQEERVMGGSASLVHIKYLSVRVVL